MKETLKNIHFNNIVHIYNENQILYVKYAEGVILTRDIMVATTEELKRLSGLCPSPVIWDLSGINYWTRNAREFMVRKETADSIKKMAIIYSENSPLDILINFFIKVHKPAYPVKYFKNNIEAICWIKNKPAILISPDLRRKFYNSLNISYN